MTTRITIVALLLAFLSTEADAQYRKHRRRGVLLGGLAGAALGVAIGDKGDNETAGALIGGAVGAIAGGTIGHQKDQRIEHNLRYHRPHPGYGNQHQGHSYGSSGAVPQYYRPHVYQEQPIHHEAGPVVLSPPPPSILVDESPVTVAPQPASPSQVGTSTVTVQDVLTMVQSGMSDAIIIRQIEIHRMRTTLSVPDVIELHNAGLSEELITAMQLAGPDAAGKMTISPTESVAPAQANPPSYSDGLLPPPPPQPQTP